MSTVYKRLRHYCATHKTPLLTLSQRNELGKIIASTWFNEETKHNSLGKSISHEPEGKLLVMSYDNSFNDRIDRLIDEYYKDHSPPPKKERKRKRIPIKNSALKSNYKQHK